MGILDKVRKNKEEKLDKAEQVSPAGSSMPEIMKDKKKSVLFGEMLKQAGKLDLAKRLREGKLDANDLADINKYREAFTGMEVESERVRGLLTEESINNLTRYHPDFKQIVDSSTPEKVIKAIESQLELLFVSDRARFDEIVSAMEGSEKYQSGKYQENEKKIEEFCSKNKIDEEEYLKILAIENKSERNLAMLKLAKSKNGRFKKVIHAITFGLKAKDNTLDILSGLKDSEKAINGSIKKLDGLQREIADALFSSLTQNESMRHALSRELIGEKAEEDGRMGWKEAKGQTLNETELNNGWEARKKRERYASKSVLEQEAIKDTFIQEQKAEYKRANQGKGFWATVFEDFIEGLIDAKKSKLK
ncbi:MAG: hypothetical protein WCG28_01485 [bacterium]